MHGVGIACGTMPATMLLDTSETWHWLIHTDAGLFTRLGVGAAILGGLAIADLRKHGRAARRWREYLFLVSVVAITLLYGAVNDQVTCWISWEYFYYGKELDKVLGPGTPPELAALRWEAAKVGLRATWTAGLILGVALLIANNPSRRWPQLGYRRLYRLVPGLLAITVACAVLGGIAGYMGWLTWMGEDFGFLVRGDMWRPFRFMATFGVHLGGYVGGLVGMIVGVVWIRRKRGGVLGA